MSNNLLLDISKVYLEKVAEGVQSPEAIEAKKRKDDDLAGAPNQKKPRFEVGPEDERAGNEAWRRYKAGNPHYGLRVNSYDPMDDPDFDPHEAEKNRGVSGKNNPKGGKKLKDIDLKKEDLSIKKSDLSNWRHDLKEIVNSDKEDEDFGPTGKEIKEKKGIKNEVEINPNVNLEHAVKEIGGELLSVKEGKVADALRDTINQMKKADEKAGLLPKKEIGDLQKAAKTGKGKYVAKADKVAEELVVEKEVKVKDTRRVDDAIRAYEKSKDASRAATADSEEGHPEKAATERKYAAKERGEIDKDDPKWKKRKYHTGIHGESKEDSRLGKFLR